jgi:prevent-host-death family protein
MNRKQSLYKDYFASVAEVQAHFSEYIKRINSGSSSIIVTKNGRPAVTIVDYEELCSLYETLDVLSEEGAMERISKAEREIERGEYLTREEIEKEE